MITSVELTTASLRKRVASIGFILDFWRVFPDGYCGEWSPAHQMFLIRSRLRKYFAEAVGLGIIPLFTLQGQDFRGVDLGCVDFRFLDLRGADFRDADLGWADFSGSDLRGANFVGANLIEVRAEGASLEGILL